jgi:hypothetical protein
MRKKIDDGGFETPYRLRKQVVEPVFGQIKQARGFRQFLLRGVEKVRAEWAMICTTHNLLKLRQGRKSRSVVLRAARGLRGFSGGTGRCGAWTGAIAAMGLLQSMGGRVGGDVR